MGSSHRQSLELPSISFLDREKVKREESDLQQNHSPTSSHSASALPPSSHPNIDHPYNASSIGDAGQRDRPPSLPSPPCSRRVSDEEQHQAMVMTTTNPQRQSLPSIQEALASPQPTGAPQYQIAVPPRPDSLPHVYRTAGIERVPPNLHTPLYTSDPSKNDRPRSPTNSANSPRTSHAPLRLQSSFTHESTHQRSPPLNPHAAKLPTLQPQHANGANPAPHSFGPPFREPQPAARYEHARAPEAGYLPPADQPYPSSYPPNSAFAAPYASSHAPTSAYAPPRVEHPEDYKHGNGAQHHPFSTSVKRGLAIFDLESTLNEIRAYSRRSLDFSQHYSQIASQSQQTGITVHQLPSLPDIDELLHQNVVARQSLQRLKEIIHAQQVEHAENSREQRQLHVSDARQDESDAYHDDSKEAVYGGSDPKKRRGRAALPGRCHSCNRLETPEWRRGPDGARTLCNACGLHWAKLKRKQENRGAPNPPPATQQSLPGQPPTT